MATRRGFSSGELREIFAYNGVDYESVKMLPWSEFCHIEHIAQQMKGVMVGVVCGGALRMSIGGEQYNIGAKKMFILHSDADVRRVRQSKSCWGYAIIYKEKFLADQDVATSDYLEADMKARTVRVFGIEESLAAKMNSTVAAMVDVTANDNICFKEGVVTSLASAFFYLLLSAIRDEQEGVTVDDGDKAKVYMARFVELLSAEHSRQRSVEYYATKLGISAKYLSLICRRYRHQTASRVIDDVVIYNAKCKLRQQGVSVRQVAEQMNFPSQSFFGKYFKQRVGISPSRYKGQSS